MKNYDREFKTITEVCFFQEGFQIFFEEYSNLLQAIEIDLDYENPTGVSTEIAVCAYQRKTTGEVRLAKWVLHYLDKRPYAGIHKNHFYEFTTIMNLVKAKSGGCFLYEGKDTLTKMYHRLMVTVPEYRPRKIWKSANLLGDIIEFKQLKSQFNG